MHAPDSATPDIQRALRDLREAIANQIQLYPLSGFFYDPEHISQEEILRYRDTLSEAIRKNVPAGERIR